jgi:hypothetical protein
MSIQNVIETAPFKMAECVLKGPGHDITVEWDKSCVFSIFLTVPLILY